MAEADYGDVMKQRLCYTSRDSGVNMARQNNMMQELKGY